MKFIFNPEREESAGKPTNRESKLPNGKTMNREDIIRMAREVGDWNGQTAEFNDIGLERFAALVAAAAKAEEREACCKIVYGQCESDNVAQRTVDAIRARGE